MDLKEKVRKFILQKDLFKKEDFLLIALSGGPDSVALIHVLKELGYTLEAMHCNFHLRGAESDRDEAFCTNLCQALGIRLHKTDFDTTGYSRKKSISLEMAARELRYEFFERTRISRGARYILTAHHRDDSIETVLMNLIQGTGIKGLRGILPRSGNIIRPLLSSQRSEIMEYLEKSGHGYVLDSTNEEDFCKRNQIRHHLIPLLETINAGARENIQRTAENLAEAYDVYDLAIRNGLREIEKQEGVISIPDLMNTASPEALLFERLHPLGFNASQIRDLMGAFQAEGTRIFSSPSFTIIKDRERLIIAPIGQEEAMPTLEYEHILKDDGHALTKDPWDIMIDEDKLQGELKIRKAKEGDWMIPLGMKGRKLLSDLMNDRKFSLLDKRRQWVLLSGEDIVWALGLRIDDRFKVTQSTRRILRIKAVQNHTITEGKLR